MIVFTPQKLDELKTQNIHIVGVAGTEGYAILEFLHGIGCQNITGHNVTGGNAMDKAFKTAHVSFSKQERENAILNLHNFLDTLHTDDQYMTGILEADMIFATQNWFAHEKNKPVADAKAAGVPVHFLTQLYFDLSPAPIIAVTGTNGKTTVTSLIYHIFQTAGIPCLMSGNDRYHPQVLSKLKTLPDNGVMILEVSNRQLKELHRGPDIGVLTCIQPDHIDEHGSFEQYLQVKKRLFDLMESTGWAVLNRSDPYFTVISKELPGQLVTYGLDCPGKQRSAGIEDDALVITDSNVHSRVIDISELPLSGDHNRLNCLAAATAAYTAGVSLEQIRHGIESFTGVKHRMEILGTINGSRFIDDEASTNPGATRAALNSSDQKVVLICGGDLKGNEDDYRILEPSIHQKTIHLICLPGRAGELLHGMAGSVPVTVVSTLDDAMKIADECLRPNVDLLLSPAGAGFHSKFNSGPKGFRRMFRDRRRKHKKQNRVSMNLPDQRILSATMEALPETLMEPCDLGEWGICTLKHEYLCPTGSHKDRAARYQVMKALDTGANGVIIPSSGNAAIAVAAAGKQAELPVYAFLSPLTHPEKLYSLSRFNPRIIFSDKPVNRARNAARRFGFPNLRPSRDPSAVHGFVSLGLEIAAQDPDEKISDLFIFCTSGATLMGVSMAFQMLHRENKRNSIPKLHAVQSGSAIELASHFDQRHISTCRQIDSDKAGFGGVASSKLTEPLIQNIKNSGGSGWFVTEKETQEACKRLEQTGIKTSAEGQAALAAMARWRSTGAIGQPVVILTGKHYVNSDLSPDLSSCSVCHSNSYGEIEAFISQWHPVKS